MCKNSVINRVYFWGMLLVVAVTTTSCAKQAYYIDAYSRQNAKGSHTIQWQINPGMNGEVAIYASESPNKYPDQPLVVEQIRKEIYHYDSPSGSYSHTYFLLVFNNSDMRVVTSRVIPTVGILNLRDAGGYMTASGEQMKWGMLYRSGDLWRSFEQDIPIIGTLGIRSQYIMSPSRIANYPPQMGMSAIEQIQVEPDKEIDFQYLIDKIYDGERSSEEIKGMHREVLYNIAFDNPNQLRIILNEMTNPAKYPILLSDDLGKDRVAFVIFLIHHILGVSKSDAIVDYMMSNDNLPPNRLEPKGFTMPQGVQEALTEYFRCEPNQINELIDEIDRRYGSINNYLTDYLHFDESKQAAIRNILLY